MMECRRLDSVHPDAPYPELWEGRTPRQCKEHSFREWDSNRKKHKEGMKLVEKAQRNLKKIIRQKAKQKDKSRDGIEEAQTEVEATMKSLEVEEQCQPPSLYLPEFGKKAIDDPCPYLEEGLGKID